MNNSKNKLIKVAYQKAIEIITQNFSEFHNEKVHINESYDRYLAQDIVSDISIPQRDISAVDGYALSDAGNPLTGYQNCPVGALTAESYQRVLTGRCIPENCVTVCPEEFCTVTDGKIMLSRQFFAGENIRKAGEDIKSGNLAVKKGTRLKPADVTRLASIGKHLVPVFRKPKISILTSGSELIAPGENISCSSQRFECDSQIIHSLATKYGLEVSSSIHIPDDEASFCKAIPDLSKASDILIACGGASNSEMDLVRPVLNKLNASLFFDRVDIKPGRPTAFGLLNDKPVFVLPGNPVAVFVCFMAFVLPAVQKLFATDFTPMLNQVLSNEDISPDPIRDRFLRFNLSIENGTIYGSQFKKSGSGLIGSLQYSEALVFVPAGKTVKKKDNLRVFTLL